jgi:UDP-glucose 4-epimerase
MAVESDVTRKMMAVEVNRSLENDIGAILACLYGQRIAVTGARGFLGTHLVHLCEEMEYKFVLLHGDIRRHETFVEPFDALIHLAGAAPSKFKLDPAGSRETNVVGAEQAAIACAKHGARLILASTCAVYAPSQEPISESHTLLPRTPYAVSKLEAEVICTDLAKRDGFPCVSLRFFNIYGKRQSADYLLGYLAQEIAAGRTPVIRSPCAIRDFVHVTDAIRALLLSALSSTPAGVYNIGTGQGHRIIDLVEILARIGNMKIDVINVNKSSGEEDRYIANPMRAHEILKWTHRVELINGLQDLI